MQRLDMAPRPYWKGHLRISLVAAPVTLYSATQASATIHLRRCFENHLNDVARRRDIMPIMVM